jgi:hypothetical protein
MREAFRYERLKAGLNSPAFFAFSDKWAAKVEATTKDSVEAIRSNYESLLHGLQSVQAYSAEETVVEKEDVQDSSDTAPKPSTEPVEGKPSPVETQKPTVQRQRFFR